MLNSLIELYGSDAEPTLTDDDSPAARQAACVQLAKRQVKELQKTMAEQSAKQLASLQERLIAAENLAASDPQGAAAMYRAIVELYAHEPWAAEIVAEARKRLEARQGEKETRGQAEKKLD